MGDSLVFVLVHVVRTNLCRFCCSACFSALKTECEVAHKISSRSPSSTVQRDQGPHEGVFIMPGKWFDDRGPQK